MTHNRRKSPLTIGERRNIARCRKLFSEKLDDIQCEITQDMMKFAEARKFLNTRVQMITEYQKTHLIIILKITGDEI